MVRPLVLLLLPACAVHNVATDLPVDSEEEAGLPFRCAVAVSDVDFRPDPRVLRWPYLSNVTHEGATVQWGLTPGVEGRLVWGETDDFGQVAAPSLEPIDLLIEPLSMQSVALSGLRPGRGYCYRVEIDGVDVTGPMAFHTAPRSDTSEKVRFLVLGDYGGGPTSRAGDVLEEILKHVGEIDFWVTTGDNVYGSGTWQEWEDNQFTFYRQLTRRGISYWPVPGNHDYGSVFGLTPMLTNFDLPKNAYRPEDLERYYAFDWGPIHFTMADSQQAIYQIDALNPVDDMLVWLKEDLARNAERPWRIAVWHHPVHMTTPGRSTDLLVALHLAPAVEQAGLPLVLNGHNHVYERFSHMQGPSKLTEGGTTYIVTGGGGKSLYEVGPDDPRAASVDSSHAAYHFMLFEADRCTLTGRAIDVDGVELDRFTLSRCGPQ